MAAAVAAGAVVACPPGGLDQLAVVVAGPTEKHAAAVSLDLATAAEMAKAVMGRPSALALADVDGVQWLAGKLASPPGAIKARGPAR